MHVVHAQVCRCEGVQRIEVQRCSRKCRGGAVCKVQDKILEMQVVQVYRSPNRRCR